MTENRRTTYRISEAARELGISAEWLRVGERRSFFPPALRDANGHRYYTEDDIERMRKGQCQGSRRVFDRTKQHHSGVVEDGIGPSKLAFRRKEPWATLPDHTSGFAPTVRCGCGGLAGHQESGPCGWLWRSPRSSPTCSPHSGLQEI